LPEFNSITRSTDTTCWKIMMTLQLMERA